ncbi:alpha/beta fold hydrolase [Aureivirga sp. CE67]|uniref:alpha/beta fold hydrolase n=1 Tax=Aureivirga sp. CE67 TaxID=1788983 RepID=UPI0018CAAAF5|nr:alpha/beta hydrolase [Aureivirga sp. CE67]
MRNIFFLIFFLNVLAVSSQNCNTEIPFGENEDVGVFARINGAKIYLESYGDPENQTLLIIHGSGQSIADMSCQITHFMENYHIIAADSRLHGKSQGKINELTYTQLAKDYVSIMDYLSIGRVFVIGYGDGANIALEMASRFPNRVSKMVVSSPNLRPGNDAVKQKEIDANAKLLTQTEELIFNNDTSEDWSRLRNQLELVKFQPNMSKSDVDKIKIPVLVVASDNDFMKLEHVVEIYNNLENAQLFVIPNSNYNYIKDESVFYNYIVEKFLDEAFKRKNYQTRLSK